MFSPKGIGWNRQERANCRNEVNKYLPMVAGTWRTNVRFPIAESQNLRDRIGVNREGLFHDSYAGYSLGTTYRPRSHTQAGAECHLGHATTQRLI